MQKKVSFFKEGRSEFLHLLSIFTQHVLPISVHFYVFFFGFIDKIYYCRWYTYLNSDFKKGGWSPEEDMLLCEVIWFSYSPVCFCLVWLHGYQFDIDIKEVSMNSQDFLFEIIRLILRQHRHVATLWAFILYKRVGILLLFRCCNLIYRWCAGSEDIWQQMDWNSKSSFRQVSILVVANDFSFSLEWDWKVVTYLVLFCLQNW